ncbi:hypothetical protein Godav_004426 [Gossypium davidsonii]|uniref:Transposase MuDR plant domain-containing protein n=2 Tax=Gossypium TaxID=3633 RepID=A0A7J8SL38_GOSDV|nr:hypothetical protein [Gossypium davidsonii]
MLVGGDISSRHSLVGELIEVMFSEEEYYKNLYFWGKFARDPHVRTLQDNLRVVWNDSTTIDMLNYCVKQKGIDLYVKHEIDTVIFADDDLLLAVVIVEGFCGGNKCVEGVEGLNGEGVKVVGSKGDEGLNKEGVEVVGNKSGEVEGAVDGGEVEGGEGGKGIEVAVSQGGEGGEVEGVEGLNGEGGDRGLNSSVEEFDEKGVEDESDSDLEDANVYVIKVMYFLDGDGDEELQEARQKLREVEGKTTGKDKETIVDETKSERFGEQFEAEVPEEVEGEGLNDRVGREEEANETEYFDSDDHSSILGSDDDNDPDACRRRSRFPTNNPNSASPLFCIWMLFKDGVQFKSAIRKYSMCCRRKLKIIKNEPNRVRIKCIASKKCK